jgi:hypothetical protein
MKRSMEKSPRRFNPSMDFFLILGGFKWWRRSVTGKIHPNFQIYDDAMFAFALVIMALLLDFFILVGYDGKDSMFYNILNSGRWRAKIS